MRVGVTGHQHRPAIDWSWVRHSIEKALSDLRPPIVGMSSLAAGADQVFADAVLSSGGTHIAVLPQDEYARHFSGSALEDYCRLLGRSEVIDLHFLGEDQAAFAAAGRFIVDSTDEMLAVWDGEPARGRGGTAEIVDYAVSRGKVVTQINPISKTRKRIVTHGE